MSSAEDKIKAATETVTGKAKEALGKVTDNDKLEAEGKGDQLKGKGHDALGDVKDAFGH
jgi:uncharacterized protein YjbJ (UPF0337 family)